MPQDNNLKLNVINFGPVVKASIDLRPLTVFVGPSNTGKSYMAMMIYALHRAFNGDSLFHELRDKTIASSIFFFARSILEDKDRKGLSDKDTNLIVDLASHIKKQMEANNYNINVAKDVLSLFSSSISLPGFEAVVDHEFKRCFNVENVRRLVRRMSRDDSTITVERSQLSQGSSAIEPIYYQFTVGNGNIQYFSSFAERTPERIIGEYIKSTSHETLLRRLNPFEFGPEDGISDDDKEVLRNVYGLPRYAAEVLLPSLAHIVGSTIVNPLDRIAHYLPADRAGMMHAHRIVVGSLISGASRAGFRAEPPRAVLSGVMADFLETLISLDAPLDQSHSPYNKISTQLESKMLLGAIRSENSEIGYPEFSYQPSGWNEQIPLMNSSSMVSELAPVVLYLRHVVKPGEVLMIEEPESHLHPAMQVEFIRLLASAVRAGVRVLLTTHSEWVLEELANLVRLSDLPEPQRDRVGGTDAGLTPEEVGVWLFDPNEEAGGSVVKEIPLDQEIGGFASGYDDVAAGTYNKWAKIGNLIEETHNGS